LDRDSGLVCGGYECFAIKKQPVLRIDRKGRRSSRFHCAYRGKAYHRYIEAHVLFRFTDFYDDQRSARCNARRTRDGLVRAFHRLHGDAGLAGYDDGLADVHARNVSRNS